MDYSNVSPVVSLITANNKVIGFRKLRSDDYEKPTPDECKRKLKGICLSYAFCKEQDFGIQVLEEAFKISADGTIHDAPFEVIESKKVKAIVYGKSIALNDEMIKGAILSGIIGYWDSENVIICASLEYGFVIDEIKEFIKPEFAKIGFTSGYNGGENLVIYA